jgi:hypothetical protein
VGRYNQPEEEDPKQPTCQLPNNHGAYKDTIITVTPSTNVILERRKALV